MQHGQRVQPVGQGGTVIPSILAAFATEWDGECVVWTPQGGAVSVGIPSEPSEALALANVPDGQTATVAERRGYVRRYRMEANQPVSIGRDDGLQTALMAAWRPKPGTPGDLEDMP